jgi:protein-tyrosine-phosphatase
VPSVLFVCTENACRSQMAEGWAKKLLPDWQAYSAGSKPRGSVDRSAIAVMQEVGIDISGNVSKGFDAVRGHDTDCRTIGSCPREFDYVVTMGCKDGCPFVPAKQSLDWNIPDPAGKDLDFCRKVRDLIRNLVRQLPETRPAGLTFNL